MFHPIQCTTFPLSASLLPMFASCTPLKNRNACSYHRFDASSHDLIAVHHPRISSRFNAHILFAYSQEHLNLENAEKLYFRYKSFSENFWWRSNNNHTHCQTFFSAPFLFLSTCPISFFFFSIHQSIGAVL
jgi:hypothetical protein